MKELPDSTKDKSKIRLLRKKNDGINPLDSRGDHDFIRRFMENYYIEEKKETVKSKLNLTDIKEFDENHAAFIHFEQEIEKAEIEYD